MNQLKSSHAHDVWSDFNFKMKQLRQSRNDNWYFPKVRKVAEIKKAENKQLELL